MIAHVAALIASLASLSYCPPATQHAGIFISAAALLVAFILGQIVIVPRMYAIVQATGAADATAASPPPDPVDAAPAVPVSPVNLAAGPPPSDLTPPAPQKGDPPIAQPAQPVAQRRIHVVGGKISLSSHLWPVLGSRDARNIIIDQFDYTCHFCRDLHKLLLKVMAERPEDLAILMMPVPMDKTCNPMVQATPPEHRDACVYSRYAMAVFRAAPDRFAEMDEWLFEPIRPWALDLVRTKAELLVGGPEKLRAAIDDPWMAKRHNEALSIYNAVGQGQLPKLLFATAVVSGPIPSIEQLTEVFSKVGLFTPPANPQ